MRERNGVSCLFLDDGLPGRDDLGGIVPAMDIPGVDIFPFCRGDARDLWDRLRGALYDIRSARGAAAVMAAGTGCAAALALACQLPVEKLVLIDPTAPLSPSRLRDRGTGSPEALRLGRALRRLAAFARRNLVLCVSDVLVVGREGGEDALRRAYGNPVNCRVKRLCIRGEFDKELYIIREFAVKEAISRFLHPIDATKPLAENPEMCIIYG